MPRACFRHYFYVIFFRSDLQRAIAFVLGDLGNAAYPCAMFVNKSNFFTPFYAWLNYALSAWKALQSVAIVTGYEVPG